MIGGGIMGLWAARKAAVSGLSVILLEAGLPGSAASGGLLGALFPWMPERWDEKKQFQFDALAGLPDEIARLEDETGLAAGYRRSGRLIPLPKPHLRTIALGLQQDALTNWMAAESRFYWNVIDQSPVPGWPDPSFASSGLAHDTLAARVFPRALLKALVTSLTQMANVRLIENTRLETLDPAAGTAHAGLLQIRFGHAVIACGHQAFPMLTEIAGPVTRPLGQPVKGQAALLQADIDPDWPVIFLDGLYVVPHEGGQVALGSTSENSFDEPFSTDTQLEDLIDRARRMLPVLAQAPVIERWAGLRPKAIGRDPMIGPVPGHPNIIAMAGGFKISFGMAHRLADCVVDFIKGRAPLGLPPSFLAEAHLAKAKQAAGYTNVQ